MSLWKIAFRSIQQRSLASVLTAFSIGLGMALVVAVLVIHSVIKQSFDRSSMGYDMIVGAKGSRLQLVLNTVYYLSQPLENIPYSYYTEFSEGRFISAVDVAIPICTGHDYKGARAIATIPEMFELLTYRDGRTYEWADGRNFKSENFFEAVVGSTAARRTGLKVGDSFTPVGSVPGAEEQADGSHEAFTVVGILAPTGTPNDRAIFMNMEGFYRCEAHSHGPSFAERLLKGAGLEEESSAEQVEHDEAPPEAADEPENRGADEHEAHQHDEHDHDHENQREITAILVATNTANEWGLGEAMTLPSVVNEEPVAQAVMPAQVIAELFEGIIGNIQLLLLILSVLVVVVAGIGMMVSMYNSMSERRHEIAVMRALGASRLTVMAIILLESILLALGGGVIGLVLGHGMIGLLGPTIAEQTGVAVGPLQFQLVELVLIPCLIVLATLVGYVPAVSAYQTDVAKSLTAAP